MSVEKNFNNSELGGEFKTDLFDSNQEYRFGVGIFSPDSVVDYQVGSLQEAYLKYRAEVYIDKNGILDLSQKRPDGTELDNDDKRSAHIIAFENKMGSSAIVGCMRLPEKSEHQNDPLPIEIFFPEVFENILPSGSKEASRFIVSYENLAIKAIIKRKLLTSAVAYTAQDKLNPVYAVVERSLKRDLMSLEVPLSQLGEGKMVEKYNSINYPIRIDQQEFANRLGRSAIDMIETTFGSVSYFGRTK